MLVCLCEEIYESEILRAIREGSLDELYERGLTKSCDSCLKEVKDICENFGLYNTQSDNTIVEP